MHVEEGLELGATRGGTTVGGRVLAMVVGDADGAGAGGSAVSTGETSILGVALSVGADEGAALGTAGDDGACVVADSVPPPDAA